MGTRVRVCGRNRQLTLGASYPQIRPSGEVRGEAVIAAHLKCSIQAAVNLRDAIDKALLRARQTPEVTARAANVIRTRAWPGAQAATDTLDSGRHLR